MVRGGSLLILRFVGQRSRSHCPSACSQLGFRTFGTLQIFSTQTMISCVISCNSRFVQIFIYCIYLTSDDNEHVYTCIRSGNCVYTYIKLTYILGNTSICFVLLWLSSIFAENFISLQLVSYPFAFFFIFL